MQDIERDVQIGYDFAKLYELGCFGEEFIVYGCSYIKKGTIYYMISPNPEKIYRFVNNSALNDIFCTPVVKKVVQQDIASGIKDEIKRNVMLQLAEELRDQYGEKYFNEKSEWIKKENNNLSYLFLKEEQEKLEGVFDLACLELFEGLCHEALKQKTLTRHSYDEFYKWLKNIYEQMENESIAKEKYKKEFSGFAYEEKGKIKYFTDAYIVNTWEKHQTLRQNGLITTPILSKEYWMKSVGELPKTRNTFIEYIKNNIDEKYFEKVKAIIMHNGGLYEQYTKIF